jgi:D-alanine-D-alanine ligase
VSTKTRVAVIMGGVSGEHDVSVNSGTGIFHSLLADKYEGTTVLIGKDGSWSIDGGSAVPMVDALPQLVGAIDVAFLALHGPNGEDGTFQSLFHLLGIPYTGSDYYASSLAMNKPRAKDAYRAAGLTVAPDRVIWKEAFVGEARKTILEDVEKALGFPCVAKTTKLGSSVGVAIVDSLTVLSDKLDEFFGFGDEVLVEKFIHGTELTAPIIDDPYAGETRALPLIEIRPVVSGWFDYEAKYKIGGAEELCPAPVDEKLTARCQQIGRQAHRILGCSGMSRTDLLVDDAGEIFVIETNTIPGFTQTSLLPQAAAEVGISYAQLVDMLIQEAIRRE